MVSFLLRVCPLRLVILPFPRPGHQSGNLAVIPARREGETKRYNFDTLSDIIIQGRRLSVRSIQQVTYYWSSEQWILQITTSIERYVRTTLGLIDSHLNLLVLIQVQVAYIDAYRRDSFERDFCRLNYLDRRQALGPSWKSILVMLSEGARWPCTGGT